jgi:alpha-tubulin suppressor-like RCC1 family protein
MKKIIGLITGIFCFLHFAFSQNIAGGSVHSLVTCSDSITRSFGDNSGGQLGTGNNFNSNFPVQVTNLTSVVKVAAGLAHSLAVKSNGTVRAWGWNGSGSLETETIRIVMFP